MSRRSWLLAGVTTPLFSVWAAEPLEIKYDGDTLRVSAPSLHFLIGKPLARLKDGASVGYFAQLTLLGDDRVTVVQRRPGRFVVSFDLWEERFSVTQLGTAPRSVEGLSAAAAEAWCLASLVIDTVGLAPDRFFWLRFEIALAEQKELARMTDQRGLSVQALVEILSRKPQENEPHWAPMERRLRLSDLPRMTGRGRNG
jgi:hypothetical protein